MKENKKEKKPLGKETVKNSAYSLAGTLTTKFAGLFIAIVLARILLPELYGIYGLILSITGMAMIFTDLGINKTITRYIAYYIGKKDTKKARSYLRYFLYVKLVLIFLVVFAIIIFSKFISNVIFQKPIIFIPLLFSCFYILTKSLFGFSQSVFASQKDFKKITFLKILNNTSRFVFAVIAVLILTGIYAVAGVFVGFAFAFLFAFFYFLVYSYKNKELFVGEKVPIEKSRVTKYILYMALAGISLKIFGAIDTLMLGRFVETEFIGYYRAALNLVKTVSALLGFGAVLLPTFTQISGEQLKRGFQKTSRYILMFSIPATAGLFMLAKYFMLAIYGKEYVLGTLPLYVLILMVLIQPLIAFYSSIFQAKEKAKSLAKSVFVSLLVNIALNYILIKSLLVYGGEYALLGAAIATVSARGIYLTQLSYKTKQSFKLTQNKISILKFVFATLVMSLFLIVFNKLVDMNMILGVIEIAAGILIYFTTLYLIKGIEKEDREIFRAFLNKGKGLFKRKKR